MALIAVTASTIRSKSVSAICIFVASLGIVNAHPVLTFTVTSRMEPLDQAKAATTETFPLVVTLGHQFLVLDGKGHRTIYDFAMNRVLRLDLAANNFQDYSLYADIGFRVLEFYNRVKLGTMLQSANLNPAFSDLAKIEHLFSLTDEKSSTAVDSAHSDGNRVFRAQQKILMTVSDETRKLPAPYQTEYWRFLRYYAGGHPAIYSALNSLKGVPAALTIVLMDHGVETRTLKLQTVTMAPDAPYSLAGYEPSYPNQEPFNSVQLVAADAQVQLQLRSSKARQDRDALFSQGKYLDALLAYNDAYLSTGEADAGWLRAAHDQLSVDAMSLRLIGAAAAGTPSASDAAAQRRALEDFASIRALKPQYSDVIDVFEGNVRLALRDDQGKQMLLSALHDNPYLTGAWHDLGDFYYRSFHMQEAWSCWDVARRIAPRAPLMQQVNQLEQVLRDRNPQFF